MNKYLPVLFILLLFVACRHSGNKQENQNNSEPKFITVVENNDGNHIAYTKEGHFIIFSNDSLGDYIVYYVKFDNNAGKYDLKGIERMIVRAEVDSSLTILRNFVCVTGGAFCDIDSISGNKVYYFDQQINGNSIEQINVTLDNAFDNPDENENPVRRISLLLDIAYNIACSINEYHPKGWDIISYALSSATNLCNYNVIIKDTIEDEKVSKRIPRILNVREELTQFNHYLREKTDKQNNPAIPATMALPSYKTDGTNTPSTVIGYPYARHL